MPNGSCVCGDWTYEYSGEPGGVAVCHCKPCQKTAGLNGSYNLIIPEGNFKKLSGSDFKYSRKGDSGKSVNYSNCGKCATVMIADIEAMPGVVLVKGGTLDDESVMAKAEPKVELYTKNRPSWCGAWSGAEQKESA
ncbi:unnamed protein product [Zymoseptoria tritici ST99CH_1A5]|nr:uncharacterized protein MYCGRDRAFT_105839 [Zymoseptoria tritici IPO323]KJX98834.1 glutathione-dependent formaldehyde-activating family protein [Zymoseptoria brevis]SMR58892.1 unnamed protein product [Zymoseptoria tritici ST99CH_1E4]SMR62740.1 unnamed protein product [Zymoseptoria tritici ST99CH_3D1]SMY28108.1 unnamed protein product [Zymoseptoria tritici ST99CH_1A5]EGP84204.1 hypothetical protein MYCGRDRAFT_105839 [Zymoseptoria tritici IPO323]